MQTNMFTHPYEMDFNKTIHRYKEYIIQQRSRIQSVSPILNSIISKTIDDKIFEQDDLQYQEYIKALKEKKKPILNSPPEPKFQEPMKYSQKVITLGELLKIVEQPKLSIKSQISQILKNSMISLTPNQRFLQKEKKKTLSNSFRRKEVNINEKKISQVVQYKNTNNKKTIPLLTDTDMKHYHQCFEARKKINEKSTKQLTRN